MNSFLLWIQVGGIRATVIIVYGDSGYNDFFLRLNSNIILSNINVNINNCNEKRESLRIFLQSR